MTLIILTIPVMSAIVAGLGSRVIGRDGATVITTFCMFINVLMTIDMLLTANMHDAYRFAAFGTWITSDFLEINWDCAYNNTTILLTLVVNIISLLVHIYSIEYMKHDPHLSRFMAYLSLFTFFMLILISGRNFLMLFLGWEGVGLCSYLLISFWFTRIQANKAAIKALVVNRIADFALTLGIIGIYVIFQTLQFDTVFPLVPYVTELTITVNDYNINALTIICILLFIGAMGKSAQIGLHTWLPDAMEGPTPVSALIHAATMVTAGIFLIIKCSPLFEYVPAVLTFITFIGATTAFFAGTLGLVQNDIKKVIAYSTCSQLGYMMFACGLSSYNVSLFHLINHAFFKALLFLSAGAIIHSLLNEQDMRKFGNLFKFLPFTAMMLLIGSLALIGFPFLTGYYSKDLILEFATTKYTIGGSFAYALGLITAFFTSFYSFRVFYMTFLKHNTTFRQPVLNIHELPVKMAVSLAILSIFSIVWGFLAKDLIIGLGTPFFNTSIFILPENNNQLDAEFLGLSTLNEGAYTNHTRSEFFFKLLPFYSSLISIGIVLINFNKKTKDFKKNDYITNNIRIVRALKARALLSKLYLYDAYALRYWAYIHDYTQYFSERNFYIINSWKALIRAKFDIKLYRFNFLKLKYRKAFQSFEAFEYMVMSLYVPWKNRWKYWERTIFTKAVLRGMLKKKIANSYLLVIAEKIIIYLKLFFITSRNKFISIKKILERIYQQLIACWVLVCKIFSIWGVFKDELYNLPNNFENSVLREKNNKQWYFLDVKIINPKLIKLWIKYMLTRFCQVWLETLINLMLIGRLLFSPILDLMIKHFTHLLQKIKNLDKKTTELRITLDNMIQHFPKFIQGIKILHRKFKALNMTLDTKIKQFPNLQSLIRNLKWVLCKYPTHVVFPKISYLLENHLSLVKILRDVDEYQRELREVDLGFNIMDPINPHKIRFEEWLQFNFFKVFKKFLNKLRTDFLKFNNLGQILHRFLISKWHFDHIYNEFVINPILKIGHKTTLKIFDKGLLEWYGPYGISRALFFLSKKLREVHISQVNYYAYFMVSFIFVNIIYSV